MYMLACSETVVILKKFRAPGGTANQGGGILNSSKTDPPAYQKLGAM